MSSILYHHTVITTDGSGHPNLDVGLRRSLPLRSGQVRVRVDYTTTSPHDLKQFDKSPLDRHIMGYNIAGTVIAIVADMTTRHLAVGDEVFGYLPEGQGHQEQIVTEATNLGKIPSGFDMQEVVGVSADLVGVFQALKSNFGLHLPFPKPANFIPAYPDVGILIIGGHTTRARYALQILQHYGYTNLSVFIPRACTLAQRRSVPRGVRHLPLELRWRVVTLILDCIGSIEILGYVAKHAEPSSIYTALAPIMRQHATVGYRPQYIDDVRRAADWRGIRASVVDVRSSSGFQFDPDLQPTIVPELLRLGVVTPNGFYSTYATGQVTTLRRAQMAFLKVCDSRMTADKSRCQSFLERIRLRTPQPPRDDERVVWRVCEMHNREITPKPQ